MTIYDKAQWHIDGGESREEVLSKFKAVFAFLADTHMLSADGKELWEGGIDSSVSLHEALVKEAGNQFLKQHYDSVINESSDSIYQRMTELFYAAE